MILDFLVMKTSRFNESQIIKAIKEHKGGRKAEDIVRGLRPLLLKSIETIIYMYQNTFLRKVEKLLLSIAAIGEIQFLQIKFLFDCDFFAKLLS